MKVMKKRLMSISRYMARFSVSSEKKFTKISAS